MENLIKKVPIPFSGVMLATAATGNLLKDYSIPLHNLFGIVSFLAFLLIISKIILYPKLVIQDLKNPILFSVSGTFFMGMFFLSVYFQQLIGNKAIYMWFLALICYSFYIVGFSYYFRKSFDIREVYTGFFIVYIGIVAAANTAPAFHLQWLGQIMFWLGLVLLLPTLSVISYRYLKYPDTSAPKSPLFGIFAAPFALCLVGYYQSFDKRSIILVAILGILSILFYLMALTKIKSIFTVDFYPSIASYTFPFVNSAIALRLVLNNFNIFGLIRIFNEFQITLAIFIVLYVIFRYLFYFMGCEKKIIEFLVGTLHFKK